MQITNQSPFIPPPRPTERARTGEMPAVGPERRERRKRQRRRNRGGGRRASDVPEQAVEGDRREGRGAVHALSSAEVLTAQLVHLATLRKRAEVDPDEG